MQRDRRLLAGAFLLSGAGALVYEIVWTRLLGLVFGSTALAVATIATVFMAGMALGALWGGSRADRIDHPARLYGLLEIGVAAYALAFPTLLSAFEAVWHQVLPAAELPLVADSLLRFGAGFALLVVPTTAMGASLPLLARQSVSDPDRVGAEVARLYGLNTLGAAVGCWLAGSHLLVAVGVAGTTWVAVSLSLAAAALALLVGRRTAPRPSQDAPRKTLPAGLLLGLAFVSGLTFMAYEVLWVRLFRMYLPHPPLEVFALALSFCLAGLGLGSLLWPFARIRTVQGLAALQAAAGLLGFLPYLLLASPREDLAATLVLSGLLFTMTGVAYGLLFPLLNDLGTGSLAVLGRTVGSVAAAVTAGNIAGSFLAGFVLLPGPGLKVSLLACALANLALAALVAARTSRALAGVAAAAAAMLAIMGASTPPYPDLRLGPGERVVFYRDGLNSSTAVVEGPQVGHRALMVESVYSRIRPDDIRTDLPLVLHPDPRRVLLVGFGTGANSHRASVVAPQARLTSVELDDNLEATAPLFESVNHGVLEREGFTFAADDGRSYLQGSRPGFDVIVMDAYLYYSHLDLYSREFTQLAKSRLAPGGIYCQRLPTFDLNVADFRALLATFRSVFPNAYLWKVGENLYMLMGSEDPLDLDRDRLSRRLQEVDARPHPGMRVEAVDEVLARLAARPAEVEEMARGGALLSELRPHRLIVQAHPQAAGVFSPLFPSTPKAQSQEIAELLRGGHRVGADPSTKLLLEAEVRPDGVHRRGVVLQPGSSGQALTLEGRPTLLYVGARAQLMQAVRREGRWEPAPLRLEGEGPGMTVDPAAVALPGGGYRLYYTYNEKWEDPGFSRDNEIHSARSADGRVWTREPGVRLRGEKLADPDPVATPEGFRLYVTRDANRIESAVSKDGLAFEPEGTVLRNATVSSTTREGRRYRMLFQREGRIYEAWSEEGRRFTEDPEPLLTAAPGGPDRIHVESPSLLRLPDGAELLLYSAPPAD